MSPRLRCRGWSQPRELLYRSLVDYERELVGHTLRDVVRLYEQGEHIRQEKLAVCRQRRLRLVCPSCWRRPRRTTLPSRRAAAPSDRRPAATAGSSGSARCGLSRAKSVSWAGLNSSGDCFPDVLPADSPCSESGDDDGCPPEQHQHDRPEDEGSGASSDDDLSGGDVTADTMTRSVGGEGDDGGRVEGVGDTHAEREVAAAGSHQEGDQLGRRRSEYAANAEDGLRQPPSPAAVWPASRDGGGGARGGGDGDGGGGGGSGDADGGGSGGGDGDGDGGGDGDGDGGSDCGGDGSSDIVDGDREQYRRRSVSHTGDAHYQVGQVRQSAGDRRRSPESSDDDVESGSDDIVESDNDDIVESDNDDIVESDNDIVEPHDDVDPRDDVEPDDGDDDDDVESDWYLLDGFSPARDQHSDDGDVSADGAAPSRHHSALSQPRSICHPGRSECGSWSGLATDVTSGRMAQAAPPGRPAPSRRPASSAADSRVVSTCSTGKQRPQLTPRTPAYTTSGTDLNVRPSDRRILELMTRRQQQERLQERTAQQNHERWRQEWLEQTQDEAARCERHEQRVQQRRRTEAWENSRRRDELVRRHCRSMENLSSVIEGRHRRSRQQLAEQQQRTAHERAEQQRRDEQHQLLTSQQRQRLDQAGWEQRSLGAERLRQRMAETEQRRAEREAARLKHVSELNLSWSSLSEQRIRQLWEASEHRSRRVWQQIRRRMDTAADNQRRQEQRSKGYAHHRSVAETERRRQVRSARLLQESASAGHSLQAVHQLQQDQERAEQLSRQLADSRRRTLCQDNLDRQLRHRRTLRRVHRLEDQMADEVRFKLKMDEARVEQFMEQRQMAVTSSRHLAHLSANLRQEIRSDDRSATFDKMVARAELERRVLSGGGSSSCRLYRPRSHTHVL